MSKRAWIGRILGLTTVLMAAASVSAPRALAQAADTITGKVVNGTGDGPVAGAPVTLQLFSQQGDLGTLSDTTDRAGRFGFDELPEGVAGYQVIATYQGAEYRSVAQAFTPGQTREETITVYEPTSDPAAVTLTDYIVWVDRTDAGVAVQLDFSWSNGGNTAYVGDGGDGGVVTVDLPSDATNLQYLGTFLEVPGEIRGDTYVSSAPIVPGTTTATMRYEAPPLSAMNVAFPFETTNFQLFVPEDVQVTAQQLRISGTITDQGLTYTVYAAQDVAAGTEIRVGLSEKAGGGSTTTALWILLAAFGLLVVIAVAIWMIGRRRSARTQEHRSKGAARRAPRPPRATPPAEVEAVASASGSEPSPNGQGRAVRDEDADLIIEEIAALDLSFEKGLLDERTYKRLRVSAKDRLLEAERSRAGGRTS